MRSGVRTSASTVAYCQLSNKHYYTIHGIDHAPKCVCVTCYRSCVLHLWCVVASAAVAVHTHCSRYIYIYSSTAHVRVLSVHTTNKLDTTRLPVVPSVLV
jgi:hypothetical protein